MSSWETVGAEVRAGCPGSLARSILVVGGCGEPDPAGEVRRDPRSLLAGQRPAGAQRAVRHHVVAVRPEHGGHGDSARLVPVELQRRDEVHLLHVGHPHAGNGQAGQGGECLDAHHSRQHGRAADAVIVQERLRRGVERGLRAEPRVDAHPGDRPDHGGRAGIDRAGVEPAGEVLLGDEHAKLPADDHLAAQRPAGQFQPDPRDAAGASSSMPALAIIFGIEGPR